MISETIKRRTLKNILDLVTNVSDETIIRAVDIGEKFFTDENTRRYTQGVKKAFKEGHPSLTLAKNGLKRLSKNAKDKAIENFFINAGILGSQKQKELTKKYGFGLPWLLVISPTARCNLNCVGCYAGRYEKNEGLSFEEVDRILTEAKNDLGIYFVVISGGEPFVWSPLFKTLEKHNDMYFLIYTNGTLITKDVAEKISEVGNCAPGISIEGFEKETDQRRGEGTFKKIMAAMDNLREAGAAFGFSATVTKNNSEIISSDEFIDLMIEKGCLFGWYFQYVPIGKNPDVSLMSTPEQRNRLRERINEIRETKPIFIGDFWNDGPHVGGCIAGARPGGYFHINSNGDVEPCVFLQFAVDNIKGKKLLDVIQSPFFKALQDAQPYCENKNLLTPCALIDNPQYLRDIVTKFNAKPSYNGSYDVIMREDICKFLDEYSKAYKSITDPIWESELSSKHKCWKDKLQVGKNA
ncbi:MAG: radical SAM protein [Dictyoglomaceae bacterium]|nr:radical SAM protein [Dictyoglomaceae bacterium]